MKRKVIIIGGVAAGTSAAAAAKRANPELEITIIEKRSKISVGACSFPYFIGGLVDSPEKLYSFTPKTFKEKKGTEVLTEHAVLEINMSNRQVSVKNLKEDKLFTMDFDILVIATGSVPIRLPIPGRELDGIFNLKFFEEAVAIKDYMKGNNVRTVGIVGGGNIGLELIENFARLGIRSFIVERFPDVVFGYDPEIREIIREELKKFEIPLYLETTAMEYSGENGKVTGIKTDKGNFHADMVIESVGIKPNSELYKDLGLPMLPNGALITNQKCQVEGFSNIYAVGDCASVRNMIIGKHDYFPLGTTANKQGRTAGLNIGGTLDLFKGTAKAQVFKLFNLEIGKTGLTEKEAKDLRFNPVSVTLDLRNKGGVFEKSGNIRIKLIADKETHKVLGCSMAGIDGVAKRLDLFTALISFDIKLEDAKNLDLTYSPPFSTVWDLNAVAIQKLIDKI